MFTPRPKQLEVLAYAGGRMGVSAVPGSGKTQTLSALAARLVAEDNLADDQEVLIVTLVNSAVDNFARRVSEFVQERGLAHTVLISEQFIDGDSFIMYLGDNLLCDGIVDHANGFKSSGADASILLTEVSHPERFGVAELNECGEVVRLVEKPKVPPSNLALVGVYLFQPIIFEAVKNIRPSWRNELEITDAIQWLVENGYHVRASVVKGWWKDTGMPEDILSANHLILDELETLNCGEVGEGSAVQGRVQIGLGTVLENGSVVRGPVIIGRNCKISNSYIGPYTSIGDGCDIVNSEIESSIVMDGTKINVRRMIVDSLIGTNVNISESSKKPNGFRFVVGDSSEVRV